MKQLPEIGSAVEGGFFAGVILLDGVQFGVAVAPKEHGEFKGCWGETGKKIDAAHVADGLANTKAMAEAGSNLAKQVLELKLNEHEDWYIPARDELELIYRNLKPSEQENYCSYRDGENPSSVPLGPIYEDESPAQTAAKNFQNDGDEAMDTGSWYWSSTQGSANYAFVQDFVDGGQGISDKSVSRRVRAVRRFLID